MELLDCLIKAWIIGVAIAAPIGPINMLCIRKTLELGMPGTLAVGLGAACADGVYSLVAALGLTALTNFLLDKAIIIKFIGGIFLLFLAYSEIKTSKSNNDQVLNNNNNRNLGKLGTQVFFLTLTSPMTILSFIGIFASIGDGNNSINESLAMVIGIFLGSISWSMFLGAIIIKIKHRLPEIWLKRLRYFSALLIGSFGVWAIGSSALEL